MIEDEVVREVRTARDAFAASHAYDIRAMVAALRELGIASGRVVVPVGLAIEQDPRYMPRRQSSFR